MNAKWITLSCAAAFICLLNLPIWAAGGDGPEDTVYLYFSALKEGDIAELRNTVTESFYNKRKVLLERNSRYGDFLIKMYKDVQISIEDIDINDGRAHVSVEQIRAGSDRSEIVLILKKINGWDWRVDQEQY